MEASSDIVRGNVDSLMKLIGALDAAGLELIGEGMMSDGGGRGVRLKAGSRPQAGRLRKRPKATGARAR